MRGAGQLFGVVVVVASAWSGAGTAGAQVPLAVFPLRFHIPPHSTVDTSWLDLRLAVANESFAPYGVAFRASPVRENGDPAALDDMDAMDTLMEPRDLHRIDVFVVASIGLLDESDSECLGLTLSGRGTEQHLPEFIAISAAAAEDVLAHELGHFFGLGHVADPHNIMYPSDRSTPPPWVLDASQGARIRLALRQFSERGHPTPITDR